MSSITPGRRTPHTPTNPPPPLTRFCNLPLFISVLFVVSRPLALSLSLACCPLSINHKLGAHSARTHYTEKRGWGGRERRRSGPGQLPPLPTNPFSFSSMAHSDFLRGTFTRQERTFSVALFAASLAPLPPSLSLTVSVSRIVFRLLIIIL